LSLASSISFLGNGVIAGGVGMGDGSAGGLGSGGVGGAAVEIAGGTSADITNNGVLAGGFSASKGGAGVLVSGGDATTIRNNATGQILGGWAANVATPEPTLLSAEPSSSPAGAGVHVTGGTVNSIVNLGVIKGGSVLTMGEDSLSVSSAAPGILNEGGTITSLVNAQGVTSPALTYQGALPTNYEVVVNDAQGTHGQMQVMEGSTGTMKFGLNKQFSNFTDVTAPKSYANVLTGLDGTTLSAVDEQRITATGAQNSGNWTGYIANSVTHWVRWKFDNATDLSLTFGPDADNTRAALALSAQNLQSMMRSRIGELSATASYDCRYFDARGLCVAVFARTADANAGNSTGMVGLASMRLNEQFRIGGYIENQSSSAQRVGQVELKDRGGYGLFLGYQQNKDGAGLQAKLSMGTKKGDAAITRSASDANFTEAGYGRTTMDSKVIAAELGWNLINATAVNVMPYISVRQSSITRDGYAESMSSSVLYPITYNSYSLKPVVMTLGVQLKGQFNEQASYTLRAGIEQGSSRGSGTYGVSSSIIDMANHSVSVNDTTKSSGSFGSVGLNYRVSNGVYLFGNFTVRRDPFSNNTGRYGMLGVNLAY